MSTTATMEECAWIVSDAMTEDGFTEILKEAPGRA